MRQDFTKFLAKSDGTTLVVHTAKVVEAVDRIVESIVIQSTEKEAWREKLRIAAILHDFGKIHPYFQARLQGNTSVSIRHELISLWFCESFLDIEDDIKFAIATHHKGVISSGEDGRRLVLLDFKEIDHLLAVAPELMVKETLMDWLEFWKLDLCLKDSVGIKRNTIYQLDKKRQPKSISDVDIRKSYSMVRAQLMVADHIASANRECEIPSYKNIVIEDIITDNEGNSFELRDFQKRMNTIIGDVLLHAPTGSGKTEAAMNWVIANQRENSRLFYLLPYTASINAMVVRLFELYGKDKVTALHSKSIDFFYQELIEEQANLEIDYVKLQKQARDLNSLSKEIFYPVKVATLHQILKTSLKGKGWELALFDYRNALFIIDEFHTYNALLTGLMLASIKLFKELFNAKFLFMSATIPFFLQEYISKEILGDNGKIVRPNPLSSSDSIVLGRKRHFLHCKSGESIDSSIASVERLLSQGKRVLVIVNNVDTCQNIFKRIDCDSSQIMLHSGFNRKSRREIEQKICHKERDKRPKLLVATQAVEVSLDIDYDVAFIENAPIDALIQRFGRVNRKGLYLDENGNICAADIYLFEKVVGKTPFYDDEVMEKTWSELSKLDGSELSEDDLVEVCDRVYETGYNEIQLKDFNNGLSHTIIRDFESDWIAADWNEWIDDVIENNTKKVDVLCSNLLDEYDEFVQNKRYIDASQLLVSIYYYKLEKSEQVLDKRRNIYVAYSIDYDPLIGYIKKIEVSDSIW